MSGAEDPHSRNMVPRLDEMEPEATMTDALEFDLTFQDSEDEQELPAMEVQVSDTESVMTVRVDAIHHDPAEEDDRDSLAESSGDGEDESEVEEEIPFRHPGVRTSQRAFNSSASEFVRGVQATELFDAERPGGDQSYELCEWRWNNSSRRQDERHGQTGAGVVSSSSTHVASPTRSRRAGQQGEVVGEI